MALSDILQFDCYVDNEFARNTLKDFAELCGEIFEKYKKLWIENLKLQKHREYADSKLKSDNYSNKVVINPDGSQLSSEICTSSLDKIIPTSSNSDTTSDLDDHFNDSASAKEQAVDDKLLRSPILTKRYFKYKKANISNNHIILKTSKNHIPHSCLSVRENISIERDSLKENECSITEYNENEIECTPITKIPKKLGISTLYNVDTTLLQNGKKLRQSKLMLLQDDQSYQNMAHSNKKYKKLTTPDKNINKDLRKQNTSSEVIEDDIIQDSPSKHTKSKLNKKSLRLKRKISMKLTNRTETDTIDHESNDIKLIEKNMNQSNLSQFFNSVYVPTQKDQSFLSRKSKALTSYNENIKNNCNVLNSSVSSKVIELEHSLFENSDSFSNPVKEIKKLEIKEHNSRTEKIKCSESISQSMLHTNSLIYNDETFYALGEQLKKESIYDIDTLKNSKKNRIRYEISESPSVKRSLTNSFDLVPEKKNKYCDKSSKKQSERAKMAGVSCWECRKYYDNLGLCEEEIKARQNQCSRHRTTRNIRESTPEGFWNPLFPETCTSTYQD
ncbi:unnamed protein product [Xylocopa violacea]|uniref:DNA endonuclease activator Ctp1 C-terminal domain-containing protein n=1 Tax=Xylocopa violacea TaxID=135666 RepID=A0ABP1P283_XYLVO